MKKKDYFSFLSDKIYLSPSEDSLNECVKVLDSIEEDLNVIQEFDVSDVQIFYSKSEFNIFPEDLDFVINDVEEPNLLNSVIDSYGFANIQNKGKKK